MIQKLKHTNLRQIWDKSQVIKKGNPGEKNRFNVFSKKESRTKGGASVSHKYRIQLKKCIWCRKNQHLSHKFPKVFYPFKSFSILNFSMTECFFRDACFANVSLSLLFPLKQFLVFYHKKDVYTSHLVRYYHFSIVEINVKSVNLIQKSK